MQIILDLRALERVLLLVTELEGLQAQAMARGEHETVEALQRALTRFCAEGDQDRATLEPSELAELELRAETEED